jgi:hypothetical protein
MARFASWMPDPRTAEILFCIVLIPQQSHIKKWEWYMVLAPNALRTYVNFRGFPLIFHQVCMCARSEEHIKLSKV